MALAASSPGTGGKQSSKVVYNAVECVSKYCFAADFPCHLGSSKMQQDIGDRRNNVVSYVPGDDVFVLVCKYLAPVAAEWIYAIAPKSFIDYFDFLPYCGNKDMLRSFVSSEGIKKYYDNVMPTDDPQRFRGMADEMVLICYYRQKRFNEIKAVAGVSDGHGYVSMHTQVLREWRPNILAHMNPISLCCMGLQGRQTLGMDEFESYARARLKVFCPKVVRNFMYMHVVNAPECLVAMATKVRDGQGSVETAILDFCTKNGWRREGGFGPVEECWCGDKIKLGMLLQWIRDGQRDLAVRVLQYNVVKPNKDLFVSLIEHEDEIVARDLLAVTVQTEDGAVLVLDVLSQLALVKQKPRARARAHLQFVCETMNSWVLKGNTWLLKRVVMAEAVDVARFLRIKDRNVTAVGTGAAIVHLAKCAGYQPNPALLEIIANSVMDMNGQQIRNVASSLVWEESMRDVFVALRHHRPNNPLSAAFSQIVATVSP